MICIASIFQLLRIQICHNVIAHGVIGFVRVSHGLILLLQLQHKRLLNFQFLREATPPLLCVGPIKRVQLLLLHGHEAYFQNAFPLFVFLTFDEKDAHEPLLLDLAVVQPNFSADGFKGDEPVAIFFDSTPLLPEIFICTLAFLFVLGEVASALAFCFFSTSAMGAARPAATILGGSMSSLGAADPRGLSGRL